MINVIRSIKCFLGFHPGLKLKVRKHELQNRIHTYDICYNPQWRNNLMAGGFFHTVKCDSCMRIIVRTFTGVSLNGIDYHNMADTEVFNLVNIAYESTKALGSKVI